MSAEVEFALKKQRLQYRSAELRAQFAEYARGVSPVLRAGDAAFAGVRWLKRHPEVIAASAIAFAVARPRRVAHLARRGLVAWQLWGRVRGWIDDRIHRR